MEKTNVKLVWKKEPEDDRDYKFTSAPVSVDLPAMVNLLDKVPEVFNQGGLGSCVANAVATNGVFAARVQKRELSASRLFVYWNARKLIGEVEKDEGCYIRDAFKTIAHEGMPPETDWPYLEEKVFERAPANVFETGRKATAMTYLRLNGANLAELKACLAQGYPFVFGFLVAENFFGNWAKKMPLPVGRILGGHAVTAIGYDDNDQTFLVKNSWGKEWKGDGHFKMPYSFITSRDCDDFWSLRNINFALPPEREKTFKEGLRLVFKNPEDWERLLERNLIDIAAILGASVGTKHTKLEIVSEIQNRLK